MDLSQRQPQPDAVDLCYVAGHAAQLGLVVQLGAVGGVDALELRTVLNVGVHQVHDQPHVVVDGVGGIAGFEGVKDVERSLSLGGFEEVEGGGVEELEDVVVLGGVRDEVL